MPKTLTQLTVFASGTSETESERSALRRVAEELNKQLEKTHSISLRVKAWPDDVRPGVNIYSQAELNRQLGSEYDIYLGVLGSRFGTPTERAGSGTEEEFNLALARLREDSQSLRLLFYFKRAVEDPFAIDVDQLQRVKRFRDRLAHSGVVYRDCQDTSEFVQQTREHLYNLVVDEWRGGQWVAIPGLSDSAEPSAPPDVPEGSKPSAELSESGQPSAVQPRSGSGALEAGEEGEIGFLEHMQKFYEAVPALIQTLETMSGHTTQMNERIRTRTATSEALQQEQVTLKHVGGSRAPQEYVSKAKQIVDGAAEDLDEYSDQMDAALSQYRTHSRAMLDNFRGSLQSGGELWADDTKQENRMALLQMIEAMQTTLQHMTEFQATIRRIPALTGKFKRARNRTAATLGELIAEITFSIAEAKQIADELWAA